MKTSTKERYYKCGHKVELADTEVINTNNEGYCECDEGYCQCDDAVVLQNPEQVFAPSKLRSLGKVTNEKEGGEEIILNEIPPDMAIDYLDDMNINHNNQKGPIKVLIPIPDNEIEKGEELVYPGQPVELEEEIVEVPPKIEFKEVRIVPENVDVLNLEGKLPEYPEPVFEEAPGENFELKSGPVIKPPYQNQEIVSDPPVELKSQPIDFKDLQPDLSTKLNIKRPYKAPWNLVNEGVRTTKMFVKAPKKLTWNETNQEQNDEYIWEAPPKPEFEITNNDLTFKEGERQFKDLEIDQEQEAEVDIKGKEKIMEVESLEPHIIQGQEKRDWNRLCEPKTGDDYIYRGIRKPDFQVEQLKKEDQVEKYGEPFSLNWDKVNEEETPLRMALPGKPRIIEIDKQDKFDPIPGKYDKWNDINVADSDNPILLDYPKTKITPDFEMVLDNNFQLPDSDAIIYNDDYNTCENNIVRPVKAIISKVNEEKEFEEDYEDIDVLEGITRFNSPQVDPNANVYSTNVNVNTNTSGLRARPNRRIRQRDGQEFLRDIEVPN